MNKLAEILKKKDIVINEKYGNYTILDLYDKVPVTFKFTKDKIKEMITQQTDKYNWQFLFLGANIDSAQVSSGIGISGAYAVNYTASAVGTDSLYRSVSKTVSNVRCGVDVDDTWKNEVV